MSILIIGANGQVGQHCLRQAAQRQLPNISCTRSSLDLSNTSEISAYIEKVKPCAIINCAAYTAVDKAEVEIDLATKINSCAPKAIAKSCQHLGIPLIHISTDYVFSGEKISHYYEEDNTDPINVYGTTKLEGERHVLESCDTAIVLRTSWVFSEYGSNFFTTMLKLANSHDSLRVVADQWGRPTYAGTIAEIIFILLEKIQKNETTAYGLYNICEQERTNWFQFAEEIFTQALTLGTISQRPKLTAIPSSDYPTPAKRPLNSELCCSKLEYYLEMELPYWKDSLHKILTNNTRF